MPCGSGPDEPDTIDLSDIPVQTGEQVEIIGWSPQRFSMQIQILDLKKITAIIDTHYTCMLFLESAYINGNETMCGFPSSNTHYVEPVNN